MQETSEDKKSNWKAPLQGWQRWAAWVVLIGSLSAIIREVLELTLSRAQEDRGVAWWLSIAIALVLASLIRLGVRCLSSWRNFKRGLFGLAGVVALVAVFYAEEDLRGFLTWNRFQAHWVARGERFDFRAFIPPSIADEQNFAMAPIVASSYAQILDRYGHRVSPPDTNVINQLQMPITSGNDGPTNGMGNWQKALHSDLEPWQQYYRRLSLTTNLFPVPPQPQTPALDVLLALSKYDSRLEELHQAAIRPGSRFPLNYDNEQTFAILLPHLAPLKGCTSLLRLRAIAELQDGKSPAALDDIRLALSLTDKIRSEPFLISHLVRIAMLQITEQAIWEGLAKRCWTEEQIAALEGSLSAFDFIADYQAAMRGENACQIACLEFLRRHPEQVESVVQYDEADTTRSPMPWWRLVPSGWFYQNEVSSSEFILERFLPVADVSRQTVAPGLVREADRSLSSLRFTPYTMLARMFLPGLANSARRFAFAQAAVNLARTAGGLERYRLASGKYPEVLPALAPKFITKVPPDPIGGQPLHYMLTPDGGYILYSIGWNEKDDGGTVCLTKHESVDIEKGDWVWCYTGLTSPE